MPNYLHQGMCIVEKRVAFAVTKLKEIVTCTSIHIKKILIDKCASIIEL